MNDAMGPMIVQTDLPVGDLIAMLDHVGKPGALSLRPDGDASPMSETLIATLEKSGLIKPDEKSIELSTAGTIIANVLLSTQCYIQLFVWNNEMEGHLRAAFPASPAAGTGVIVNQTGSTVHLQAFADNQALIEFISPVISNLPDAVDTSIASFEASLSFEQAAVVSAMLDMMVNDYRERPQSSRIRALSATAIAEWLDLLWAGGDRTSLSGQVFSLALNPDPPKRQDVNNVLEELTTGGLLIRQDEPGSYFPATALLELVEVLDEIDGGFDLERVDRTEDGPPAGRILHVMCGSAGAFIIELAGTDRIHLELADRAATISIVANILVGELTQKQSQAPEPPMIPPQAPVRNRFCTHCGKPIEPSWHFCKACGTAIGGKAP